MPNLAPELVYTTQPTHEHLAQNTSQQFLRRTGLGNVGPPNSTLDEKFRDM